MEHLADKTAVVTGAASGIGFALATRFATAGMRVVLADIEEPALTEAATQLRGRGHDVTTVVCDVARLDDVENLRQVALDAYGAVHVVCNNAGVGSGGAMADIAMEEWDWVLGVNLWGVIHGIRTFLPLLTEQGEGHIVNTASVAGLFSAPFMGPYNASKFAVVALSETLFQELRFTEAGVGVSVLCPAWVRTRIAESARNRPVSVPVVEARDEGIAAVIGSLIEQGLDPAEVADQVFDAIVHERFYVLTHPESVKVVSARTDAIVAGDDPPFAMP